MKYALGNMLNGAGGLNADQLALDLQFAEDKTLTARKGPTPTLTRASSATYVGTDGLIHGVDTSTTSLTIGTGSKTVTLAATAGQDQMWRSGDAVEIINTAGFGMTGTVTSYTKSTQVLVCDITSAIGSGTSAAWRIGYRGPRFDHNPANPTVCRGLLIEEGRTNLVLQSENFGTTWTNDTGLVAISVDQTTSPSGEMDADKISENTTASNRRISIQAQTFVSGTTYTFSCFVKAAERDFVQLRFGTAFGGQFQNFIVGGVNAGSIGSGVGATPAIQAYPNGWYRCSITATSAASGPSQVTIGPQVSSTAAAWNPYVGTIGSGIFVWGAQNEAGSFPTSYIPTTTSTLTRTADVCSITGASSTFGNTDGTLFTIGGSLFISTTTNNNICSIESGTTGQLRIFTRAAQAGRLSAMVSNVILTPSSGYNTAGVFYKAAVAANASGADYVIDGTQIPDTYTGSSITADNLKITGAGGATTNSWISSIQYYKKRLPVSKLQAITA